MIDYRIVCQNGIAGNGYVQLNLLDKNTRNSVQSAVLTREIDSRMFVGKLTVSLLPDHPGYETVKLMTSTIFAYENNNEVFRGRAVSITINRQKIKKIVCEGDLKFLVDVPDIFSKVHPGDTTWFIGDEKANWNFTLAQAAYSSDDIYAINHLNKGFIYTPFFGASRMYGEQLAPHYIYDEWDRPSEYPDNGQYRYIYTSNINTDSNPDWSTESLDPEVYGRYWWDYGLTESYSDQLFVVEYDGDTYYIPLLKFDFLAMRNDLSRGNIPTTAMFLGNPLLPHPKSDAHYVDDGIRNPFPANWSHNGQTIENITVTKEGVDDPVPLTDLPFCVINYIPDYIFGYALDHRHNETIIYADAGEPGPVPKHTTITLRISLTDKTKVGAMYNSIFFPYSDGNKGYNKLCSPDRHIYRGTLAASLSDTDVEHSRVDTVYSDLQTWLTDAGGYAKITKYTDSVYVLDLTDDTEIRSNDMTVTFGVNVTDYSGVFDAGSVVTGIYMVGVYDKDKRVNLEGYFGGSEDSPVLPTGYTLEDGVIYNDAARELYGKIITYSELTLEEYTTKTILKKLASDGVKLLREKLTAAVSFDISVIDPRLQYATDTAPILGNSYPVDIPILDGPQYIRLQKITTDMIKPSGSKLTIGDKIYTLSDYVATKERRT